MFENKLNNKGFTMIELLAVIIILGVIMVLVIPTVLGNMKKSKEKSFMVVGETIVKYLEKNYSACKLNKYSNIEYDGDIFNPDCSLKTGELSDNLIKNSGYSKKDIEEIIVTGSGGEYQLALKPAVDGNFAGVDDLVIGKNETEQKEPIYVINKPEISNDLVPVIYDETKRKWQIVSESDPNWYNYSNQKWANAVLLKNKTKGVGDYIEVDVDKNKGKTTEDLDVYAMFVWIPRFSYTIGCNDENNCYGYNTNKNTFATNYSSPGTIDIQFISKNYKDTLKEGQLPKYYNPEDKTWYTHPAFTFGEKELSGIWVGKFETSVNQDSECYKNPNSTSCEYSKVEPRILPNVKAYGHNRAYTQFMLSRKYENSNYNIKKNSHMMKNSEWAAVTYLAQSEYGRGLGEVSCNDNEDYYTGHSHGFPAGYSNNSLFNSMGIDYNYDENDRGPLASTTGNVYGVYDMAGGLDERVMAVFTAGNENFNYSGFTNETKPDKKYFDEYKNDRSAFEAESTKESVGHALYEVMWWHYDFPPGFDSSFITRGGNMDGCSFKDYGIFYGYPDEGYDAGFRIVLVNDN